MNRYPTHLHFDSSGSAVARFFGTKVADVVVHRVDRKMSQALMACPESVGEGTPCLLCRETGGALAGEQRSVAMAWDLHKCRWCVYVAPPFVIRRISDSVSEAGFVVGERDSPDVILQRQRGNTLVCPMGETASEERGDGNPPPLEDYLLGMKTRSIWAKYARPSDVPV